jgi:hypothetical protein
MWAVDKTVAMPDSEELKKMSIENTPKDEEIAEDDEKKEAAKKLFPFQLRVIDFKKPTTKTVIEKR